MSKNPLVSSTEVTLLVFGYLVNDIHLNGGVQVNFRQFPVETIVKNVFIPFGNYDLMIPTCFSSFSLFNPLIKNY